jgi:hypothetical protein
MLQVAGNIHITSSTFPVSMSNKQPYISTSSPINGLSFRKATSSMMAPLRLKSSQNAAVIKNNLSCPHNTPRQIQIQIQKKRGGEKGRTHSVISPNSIPSISVSRWGFLATNACRMEELVKCVRPQSIYDENH